MVGADPPSVGVNLRAALGQVTISGGATVDTTGAAHATGGLSTTLGGLDVGVSGQAGADQQVTATVGFKF